MILKTRTKMALARAAYQAVRLARRLTGRPLTARFQRGGFAWELDLRQGVDFAIFLLGRFEPDFARAYDRLIRPGEVLLDLGANLGAHSLPFARLVGPSGRVVAVEATAYACAKFRRNLELNPAWEGVIRLHHALLVESPSAPAVDRIYASWPLEAEAGVHHTHDGRLEEVGAARRLTVDHLVAEEGLTRVDWIKLDVDGHELGVLRGARDTLRRHHPRLLMELAPSAFGPPGDAGFTATLDLLLQLGYRFRRLPGRRPLPDTSVAIAAAIPYGASLNALVE